MSETQEQLNAMFRDIGDDIGDAFDAADSGVEHKGMDANEYIAERAYGVTVETHLKIELAGGGPSAWIDAEVSRSEGGHGDLELDRATFHAVWYGNAPVERRIHEGDALWRYASYIVEGMSY